MNATEKHHRAGLIDTVEHTALLVHPEGDDVPFVGELLREGLGPEATLRDQVRAGVLGKVVWIDPGRILGCEAKA